jgi:hypothetical protein
MIDFRKKSFIELFVCLFVCLLAISAFFSFGITAIFAIIFGHASLIWWKSDKSDPRKIQKAIIYLSLLIAYGYFALIVFLILAWNK